MKRKPKKKKRALWINLYYISFWLKVDLSRFVIKLNSKNGESQKTGELRCDESI